MWSLLVAAHSLEDRIEGSLGELGLSLAKLNVLSRMVEADEPLTLGEIASRLKCVRSNVTQLIDRLESDGLVRREADPSDRRSTRAVLTPEGKERQQRGADELSRVNGEFEKSLSGESRTALVRALNELK
jgi:DNA-binding MarR family transcriptional regulator